MTVLVEVSVVVLTDVSVVVVGVGFIGQSEFEKKTQKNSTAEANTYTTVSINCLAIT